MEMKISNNELKKINTNQSTTTENKNKHCRVKKKYRSGQKSHIHMKSTILWKTKTCKVWTNTTEQKIRHAERK